MNQFWRVSLSILPLVGLTTDFVLGQITQPNRQQALYDQYYGISPKTSAVKPIKSLKPVVVQPSLEPIQEKSRIDNTEEVTTTKPLVNVSTQTRVRIGARGGILTPMLLDNNTRYSAGTDFSGGVLLVLGSGRIQFQPEINYSRTAFRSRFLGTGITRSATDQIVVPLLARISFGRITGTQFYINAGPYSAYETSTSLNGLKVPFDRDEQRGSYGAAAGIGVAIRTGPGHISLDVRGRYQLTTQHRVVAESQPAAVYTEATLSYLYPLGRR